MSLRHIANISTKQDGMHLRCLLHGAVLRRRVRVGGDLMKVSCPEERVRKVCEWIAFEDESGRRVNYLKMVAIMRMCHRAVDDGTLVNRDMAYYEALRMGWGIADAEDVFKRDHDCLLYTSKMCIRDSSISICPCSRSTVSSRRCGPCPSSRA